MMIHLQGAHLLRWGRRGSWWTLRGFHTPAAPLLPAGPRCHPIWQFGSVLKKKYIKNQETVLPILLICVSQFICLSAVAPSGRCFKTCATGVVSKFKLKGSCCFCLHAFCFGWIQYHRISTTPSEISFSLSCKSLRLLCILSSAVLRVPSPANKSHCTGGRVRHTGH